MKYLYLWSKEETSLTKSVLFFVFAFSKDKEGALTEASLEGGGGGTGISLSG